MNIKQLPKPTEIEIEAWVRSRQTLRSKQAITRFLKENRNSESALFQACDWYRRLGLYADGLAILRPEDGIDSGGRRALWLARFYNLLGTPGFAQKLIKTVQLETAEDFRVAGGISLSNGDYAEAMKQFERMKELDSQPDSYSSRLALLGIPDCLAGLGKPLEAIPFVTKILESSKEPLLKGICNQALGSYWARAGDFDKARIRLELALSLFPVGDRTADSGFLFKWLGYTYAKLDKKSLASKYFKRGFEILGQPSHRDETWLDLLRLRAECGLSPRSIYTRIQSHPGLLPALRALLPPSQPASFGPDDARMEILLDSGEFRSGAQRYLGLTLQSKLLAWLRIAEDWGLAKTRLKSLLWNDELLSYLALEDRLKKLIARTQFDFGVKIETRNRRVYLSRESWAEVCVKLGPSGNEEKKPPLFLQLKSEFSGREFENFYSLARSSRLKELQRLCEHGWIEPQGPLKERTFRSNVAAPKTGRQPH